MSPLWSENDGWFPQSDPTSRGDWVAEEMRDAEEFLTNLVAEEMLRDPDVRAGHMLVMVQNGVVILHGAVDTDDTRSAAVRRAWATPGVFDVCNMLKVARGGQV